ncbi:protein adenylyltransferase SelO [Thermithiobacillus plumbiphilus]|uniref:Protein nucleotidyltransferase YdiU n=1 Tax=Thermithiobacillus plumbiphilus TaxID=1729899 RepID=A0ABU9D6T5_9PROT
MPTFDQRTFDNSFAGLPDDFFSRVRPDPLPDPYLVSVSDSAAALLDLDPASLSQPEGLAVLAGARVPAGADPIATLYSGHQFGHYVPQLGDGRAILLGEVRNQRGEHWEIQLKGAGQTPFSRMGDGRAVLRSTIREYLCSEAMHGLGIPTTRALAIVGSDLAVYREEVETGAVLARLAPSHVRFGHFEVYFYRDRHADLKTLADYVIDHDFPGFSDKSDKYTAFFQEVLERTARLIARWQTVGFAHGVMNTDNMSILGLTIDYGPYGFLDAYDPGFICNHSDNTGRYAFDNQPRIAMWNLSALAQALSPLVPVEEGRAVLERFGPVYATEYVHGMCAKLGLLEPDKADIALFQDLLKLMAQTRADYTNFFRTLSRFSTDEGASNSILRDQILDRAGFDAWALRYRERLLKQAESDDTRATRMNVVNPKYILRNYLAQNAIARAQEKDFSELNRLLDLLRRPFDEQPEMEIYAAPPPDWASHISVSCSS